MEAAARMCFPLTGRLFYLRQFSNSHKRLVCSNHVSNNHTELDYGSKTFSSLDTRIQVLDAALDCIPEYGWTKRALAAGAESIGLPGIAHGMFKGGGAELIFYLNFMNNRKLENQLQKQWGAKELHHSSETIGPYLHDALKARLKMTVPFIKKWSEAMALMAMPQHVASDFEMLMDLIDKVWFFSGDKNINSQWYSRRLSLGAVYKLSELQLMQDKSEDYVNTWNFLQRQIEMVAEMDHILNEAQWNCSFLSEFSESTFIMVKNMVGIKKF